ncbi:hypothetical protein Tco_0683058 [Tanacetum coccineum]|uniref:Uncharacterized protein n=1 Tax=Tanacetum coccineum TaxID=301880 RepID=A0ABQ4XUV3_9ASTR
MSDLHSASIRTDQALVAISHIGRCLKKKYGEWLHGMVHLPGLVVSGAYVDFRVEAQLFVGIVRSDDGIFQAGSGVAVVSYPYKDHQESLHPPHSTRVDRVLVVVQAEYSAEAAVFEELGVAVLVD